MHDLNGALYLKVSFLFPLLALLVYVADILTFATKYASPESQKFDLRTEVLNFRTLLKEYWPLDKSFTSIHSLVTKFFDS